MTAPLTAPLTDAAALEFSGGGLLIPEVELVRLGQGREWRITPIAEESAGWAVVGSIACATGLALGMASLWIWPV